MPRCDSLTRMVNDEHATFVGRTEELGQLFVALSKARAGKGQTLFIAGNAGSGKSTLIKEFLSRCQSSPEFRDIETIVGHCFEDTGSRDPYSPFAEMGASLANPPAARTRLQSLKMAFRKTADGWLQTVPYLGSALSAVYNTRAEYTKLMGGKELGDTRVQPSHLFGQFLAGLEVVADSCDALVLILEDAHWIDATSSEMLRFLARGIADMSIVILVCYRPAGLGKSTALTQTRLELVGKSLASGVDLSNLTVDDIDEYLRRRFGTSEHPSFGPWLHHVCAGHPLFFRNYLGWLDEEGIIDVVDGVLRVDGRITRGRDGEWQASGRIEQAGIPPTIDAVLAKRVERVDPDKRGYLAVGAVQGMRFSTNVVATIEGQQELRIQSDLKSLADRYRLIELRESHNLPVPLESDVYAFDHALMRSAFYSTLTPGQSRALHKTVGETLEAVVNERSSVPTRVLISIANHFRKAGVTRSYATFSERAASSCFEKGGLPEALTLCEEAVDTMACDEQRADVDDLCYARIVAILLNCVGSVSRGVRRLAGGQDILEIADRAIRAATRAGDAEIEAVLHYQKGNILHATDSVEASLVELERAYDVARRSGDKVIEAVMQIGYGHQLKKQDVSRGLQLMHEGYALYRASIDGDRDDRTSCLLLERLGVGEFDHEHIGNGERLLEEAVAGLERLQLPSDLLTTYNYLAQVYLAGGQFEQCEATLQKALSAHNEKIGPNAWHGNNLALLGKLYVEWGRMSDAEQPLMEGYRESQRLPNIDLITLVRNYVAEFLLHPHNAARNPGDARKLPESNIEESQAGQFSRSEVMSLCLLAQLELTEGHADQALQNSERAVALLEAAGVMPAVRSQEVYFCHSVMLAACDRRDDAEVYLDKAAAIIATIADTIEAPDRRETFLSRVPINQQVLAAQRREDSTG